ncbi:caspase family protein [Cronobacter turicensis]|nr:caspase family protein [Cronobacter turicensis]ELQ6272610.1 caspase family protein [Cronobacter turicensis]
MNLAILIGVSEYDSQNNLPACKHDVELMQGILDASKKYSNILTIDSNTSTSQVKLKITEFIKQHQPQPIDELFFYFSGHGFFNGTEFLYILSDYDNKKPKSTSLENGELDVLIKSLSPKLTVKIVDACNSGVSYIKDPDALSKHVATSKEGFQNCYFMFSSGEEQYSFADDYYSFFTKAIGEAVVSATNETIRYKDIIDYVSDTFSLNSEQSPVFVSQATFTEIFVEPVTKESKSKLLTKLNLVTQSVTEANKHSLKELVEQDAKRFFSEHSAIEVYNKLTQMTSDSFVFKGECKDLFDIRIDTYTDYSKIPNLKSLAEWADKNSENVFVKAIKQPKEVSKRQLKLNSRFFGNTAIRNLMIGGGLVGNDLKDNENFEWVTETVYEPVSLESTVDVDFNAIVILAKTKYPNINSMIMYILPFLGRTKLILFSGTAPYKPSGWESEELQTSYVRWSSQSIELIKKEELGSYIEKLAQDFESQVTNPILEAFKITPPEKTKK